MTFMELALDRFSVRDYKDTPIEREKLDKILEAGRIAPTGANKQPFKIYVIQSPEGIEKIRGLTRCAFNAPVVLMFTVDEDAQWKNPIEEGFSAGEQDVSIVATHVMLMAWELGVGSCWVNYFPPRRTAEEFSLPVNERAALLMPIGYAADGAEPRDSHNIYKAMDEIVEYL